MNNIIAELVLLYLWFDRSKTKSKASLRVVIISLVCHKVTLLFCLDFPWSNNRAKYEPLNIDLKILLKLRSQSTRDPCSKSI
jgi:hypothetical protein